MQNEGQIITVSGPIDPAEAGITLMHEHMLFAGFWLFDYSAWVDSDGRSGFDEHFDLGVYAPVTRENAVWLRYHPYVNRENLINTDWRLSATELRRFKLAGGGTIVDASSPGKARRLGAAQDLRGRRHARRRRNRLLRREGPPLGHG